jgi:hypothetical protein
MDTGEYDRDLHGLMYNTDKCAFLDPFDSVGYLWGGRYHVPTLRNVDDGGFAS